MYTIAIDIGNSNVVIGVCKNNEWIYTWRLPTSVREDAYLYYQTNLVNLLFEAGIGASEVQQVVISSVVPDLSSDFEQLITHIFPDKVVFIRPTLYHLFDIQTDNPAEIGTDLLANAVAAHHLYQRDCIIVDFGTALTFTTVNKAGQVMGVSIAPGLKTAISALFQKTAQLPEVPLELPQSVLGKNTVHAIQSGILIGYVGLVQHMLQAIRAELGSQFIAVATGGLSGILHPLQGAFEAIDSELTLKGLKRIGELVQEKKVH
ncbi:MAG: type III pantothenate kinase [Bacteroidota bacterium]